MMNTERPGFGAPKKPWKMIGFGVLMLAAAGAVYFYLAYLEQQGVNTEINWLLAKLYELGGKPLAAGFFAVIGLIAIGLGIAGVANQADDTAMLRAAPPVAQQELTALLMPALEFTNEDLAANQRGFATERQQARLSALSRKGGAAMMISMGLTLLIILGIGVYALFLAPTSASLRSGLGGDSGAGIAVAAGLGVFVLFIIWMMVRTLRRLGDFKAGKVSVIEGPVKLEATEVGAQYRGYVKALGLDTSGGIVKVGGQSFYVTEKALNAFKHNAPYRIYYLKNPPAHVVLSAEALAAA